jgi:enhancing lycopene biosynthesis protein 2
LTLGSKGEQWPYSQAINIAESWGNTLVHSKVDEVVFDEKNLIFSTPAYMYSATPAEVFNGIEKMIN